MRWYPYSRTIVSSRFFVEAVTSGWVINSGRLTGKNIEPVSISLSYPKPTITTLFLQTFGKRVLFDQTYNSISFRKQDMDLPIRHADPKIYQLLCAQADEDIVQLEAASSHSEKVEYQIKRQLAQGGATIEVIASRLNIAPRTLQRYLTAEGTSFKELLNNVRHELALHYLQDPARSTLDVALKLGYNQDSSFCTAFIGWTGVTPSKYSGSQ